MEIEKSEYYKKLDELHKQKCPVCAGHGHMVNLIDADAEEYKHVECLYCLGSGIKP